MNVNIIISILCAIIFTLWTFLVYKVAYQEGANDMNNFIGGI